MKHAIQNNMTEWAYNSGKTYTDPFNEVEVDVMFTAPDGTESKVPAFWAGDHTWRIRYSSPKVGRHHYRTLCSDSSNDDLHGLEGDLDVSPYQGDHPLLQHGPLKISSNKRFFEHLDGTPFFWLADTWWMGLCNRLHWPNEFELLAADRVKKGFSVIQIVAGLYPDMPQFDPRGANEAGYPWSEDYSRINPSYFDMADLKIQWLVQSGLVPCLVGCWGYFIEFMGVEKMKQHWRYLVARYGALPMIWCLAGEAIMRYYVPPENDSPGKLEEYVCKARTQWTEVTRYVRSMDPYQHPITLHPCDMARKMVDDPSLLDFDMLQTGHGSMDSMPNTVNKVVESYTSELRMPVINGEVCYEGICGRSWQNVQRYAFWSCVLNGAAGHTYGGNGIWQLNRKDKPFGRSPHGISWGDAPWEEVHKLPGSEQVGVGRRLFDRYPWWEFEPHAEWVEHGGAADDVWRPFAAGIPRHVRIVFVPSGFLTAVTGIESDVTYRAFYFDPRNGNETDLGEVNANTDGRWIPPKPPIFQDWVLGMEAVT